MDHMTEVRVLSRVLCIHKFVSLNIAIKTHLSTVKNCGKMCDK
jgi:hypothetical protein